MITRRSFLKSALGATTALGVWRPGFAFQETDLRRNILLIIADDLGVDKIPLYRALTSASSAATSPQTPTLERLAESGVVFRHGWSHAVCPTTRASTYTGLHPYRHGIGGIAPPPVGLVSGLSSEEPTGAPIVTLGEALQRSGYQTALFGKWHLGDEAPSFWPINRGWHYHAGCLAGSVRDYCDWPKLVAETGDDAYVQTRTSTYATEDVVNEAEAWISVKADQPWFATLAFNAPHSPFHEPNSSCDGCLDGGTLSDGEKFDLMTECMDAQIGALLDRLDDAVLANTLIFFVGDNGTPGALAAMRRRGKGTMFRGGVHVPFIAADGGHLVAERNSAAPLVQPLIDVPGGISDHLVHVVDLYATIAALAGAASEIAPNTNSIDFSPGLKNPETPAVRDVLFSQNFIDDDVSATVMAQDGMFKLNYAENRTVPGCYELFDLSTDPDELVNVFGQSQWADIQNQLIASLQEFFATAAGELFPETSRCG